MPKGERQELEAFWHGRISDLALWVGLGIALGALSHLALDEMNVSGERLLWPFVNRELRLRWPSVRVGSAGEWGFASLLRLAAGFLVPRLVNVHILQVLR
jgi:membrane-bound metal-dependent hydrolase YbcI (DUF457 family)